MSETKLSYLFLGGATAQVVSTRRQLIVNVHFTNDHVLWWRWRRLHRQSHQQL